MAELFENTPSLASIRDDERVVYDTRIDLTESQLQRLAGEYRVEADDQQFSFTIAVRHAGLAFVLDGQEDALMYPESETLFRFVKGGQASFELASDGSVSAMILHRNGDHRAPRVP